MWFIFLVEDYGDFKGVFEKFSELENQSVEEEPTPVEQEPEEERFDESDSDEDVSFIH